MCYQELGKTRTKVSMKKEEMCPFYLSIVEVTYGIATGRKSGDFK